VPDGNKLGSFYMLEVTRFETHFLLFYLALGPTQRPTQWDRRHFPWGKIGRGI